MDTMFSGDVGRPDLLASMGFSRDELAEQLYDSLHNKLLPLPDATRVFPAHGAGSACGKNLSTDTSSTIGEQRISNFIPWHLAYTELSFSPAYCPDFQAQEMCQAFPASAGRKRRFCLTDYPITSVQSEQ